MSKMLKISGAWDVWNDEELEPFDIWLNVDSVIALMPDRNVIVMGGDGAQFTCTTESFERVCKAMGVMRNEP